MIPPSIIYQEYNSLLQTKEIHKHSTTMVSFGISLICINSLIKSQTSPSVCVYISVYSPWQPRFKTSLNPFYPRSLAWDLKQTLGILLCSLEYQFSFSYSLFLMYTVSYHIYNVFFHTFLYIKFNAGTCVQSWDVTLSRSGFYTYMVQFSRE